MKIYKYYKSVEYAFSSFDKDQICFNSMTNFTDPMEGRYQMESLAEISDFNSDNKKLPGILTDTCHNLATRLSDDYSDLIRFKFRVLSMADNMNYNYMWKEYAGQGTGFCLGYNFEDISKLADDYGEIRYKEIKVPDGYFENLKAMDGLFDSTKQFYQEILEILFSKILMQGDDLHREDFDKEHEIRFVREVRLQEVQLVDIQEYCDKHLCANPDKEYTYFADFFTRRHFRAKNLHFEKAIPTEVYAGFNISDEDFNKLKRIADKHGIDVVKVKEEELIDKNES